MTAKQPMLQQPTTFTNIIATLITNHNLLGIRQDKDHFGMYDTASLTVVLRSGPERGLDYSSLLNLVGWLNCFNAELSKEVLAKTAEIPGGGKRGRLYSTLHCHHQNDNCIKQGSSQNL